MTIEVTCQEPKGEVKHEIKPMVLTPSNLRTFWEKAKKFETIFGEEISGDFKKFLEVFLREGPEGVETNGLFWVMDDFLGVLYINRIIAGEDANAHFTFFDGRVRGREPVIKEMLAFVFDKYGFRRLSVEIPMYVSSAVFGFVERVGFKNEGRKRKAAFYKGDWFDVKLYGILKEEVDSHGQ